MGEPCAAGARESVLPAVTGQADFFGPTLDIERVRVVESPTAGLTGRPFVTRNTIRWPGPPPESATDPETSTLVHELAHCWQHQTGRRQLLRGVIEQTLHALLGRWLARVGLRPLYDPYDYGGPEGLAGTARLDDLRLEAQAMVIEHLWLCRRGADTIGDRRLREADGSPTAYARDLERLCLEAGLSCRTSPRISPPGPGTPRRAPDRDQGFSAAP